MAGFRTFLTGEVLTAVNVNDFLMKQSVMVFADAAARTAALGGEVAEGMLTFTEDNNLLAVFNGFTFVPLRTTQGYLGTRTYTSTGTFVRNDAFGDGSNVRPRAIVMTLVGGGGGGGGAGITAAGQSGAGGGGGAGAVGYHVLDAVTIESVLLSTTDVIVGAGGAGGVGAASGAAGGFTSFQVFGILAGNPLATGGLGGAAGAATSVNHMRVGGDSGFSFDCNVENAAGGAGGASVVLGTSPATGISGAGGGNALAGASVSVQDAVGAAASFPGGGGSGARNPANRAITRSGAQGRRGLIIMDIYI